MKYHRGYRHFFIIFIAVFLTPFICFHLNLYVHLFNKAMYFSALNVNINVRFTSYAFDFKILCLETMVVIRELYHNSVKGNFSQYTNLRVFKRKMGLTFMEIMHNAYIYTSLFCSARLPLLAQNTVKY